MSKIYGGFKKDEKFYSYGSVKDDFESIRNEIEVDDIDEGLFFMENYFGKDIPSAPRYSWIYDDASDKRKRDYLIAKIDAPAKEAVVEEVEVSEEENVLCSCGCYCPKSLVMVTSMGTSCPDCYDDMSL